MTAAAPGLLAAASLLDGWRDLGPTLWLLAAAGLAVWATLLAVAAFATRSRDVDPGAATLDLGGPESVAVVNLLTNGWRLGHEALPATLLDLAARRIVAVNQVGEQTLVRVRGSGARDPAQGAAQGAVREAADLEPYERMVLDHVVHHAVDGVVPAEALTTGPEHESRGWWRKFRKAVERDARGRGLSRQRWSPVVHTVLVVASLAVAALVAVAATTLPDDPDSSDDDPVGAALAFGGITAGLLIVAVEAVNGERDTPAGRTAASRWLGLRTLLAEDPLFAEYPPAGVAIWDRLLAFGAAMGVAHGAVRALPLGAESDREAWSSVGGHWRVVRIRYPRFIPPGYGRRPGVVAVTGLLHMALAIGAFRVALLASTEVAAELSSGDRAPFGVRVGVSLALGAVLALTALLVLRAATMVVAGAVDLFASRRPVEGRVLRVRRRGDDEHPRWYVATDDGTAPRIRAWYTLPAGAVQGCTVRADVSPWLSHVRNLTVVTPAPARPALPDDEPEAEGPPLSALLGTVGASGRPSLAALAEPVGPPPPLPDAALVSEAVGRPLDLDTAARPHPLARDGRSATFGAPDGTMVQVAWVDASLLQAHRSMPRFLRRTLTDVGDEAYRAVVGGGVVARRDSHVLLVMGRLPGRSDGDRDEALQAVARATLGQPEHGRDP